jgi:hypothetical protein
MGSFRCGRGDSEPFSRMCCSVMPRGHHSDAVARADAPNRRDHVQQRVGLCSRVRVRAGLDQLVHIHEVPTEEFALARVADSVSTRVRVVVHAPRCRTHLDTKKPPTRPRQVALGLGAFVYPGFDEVGDRRKEVHEWPRRRRESVRGVVEAFVGRRSCRSISSPRGRHWI